MKKTIKNTGGCSPFNCIALKDVKDKNSEGGSIRNLFDCVTSIDESVAKLNEYTGNGPESDQRIAAHISSLTAIQKDLLAICQEKIGQPVAENTEGTDAVEEAPVVLAEEVPEVKSKLKV